MRRAWHTVNASFFEKLKQDIEAEYPDLRVITEDGAVFARGSFPVRYDAEVLDRFLVEIRFPDDYPHSIPVVREIGGRIPYHQDRHVNPTGEACPIVPEEWLIRPDHDSILSFLNGPIWNFFISQILVEKGHPWPFGERQHGIDGLFQAYGEMLGTADRQAISRYLQYLSHDRFKGHWECPCGSGKRLRHCHLDSLRILREKIAPWVAERALSRISQQK